MKKIILFWLGLCFGWSLSAQNTTDSLKTVLQNLQITYTLADTLRVQTLNNLAFALRNTQVEQAAAFAKEASEISEKINYPKGLARSLGYEGIMAYRQGKYDFAITFHIRSLKIATQIADSTQISFRYNDLANVYLDKGDFDQALVYNLKSLEIKELRKDKEGIATSYRNLGLVNLRKKNYEQAISYLEKTAQLAEQIGNQRLLAYAYIYLGEVYTAQNQHSQAILFLEKAVRINQQIQNNYGLAEALNSLAQAYLLNQNIAKSVSIFTEALNTAQKTGIKLEIQRSYLGLSAGYQKQNRLAEALDAYQKYTQIKDSIFSEKSAEHIAYLEAQFQNEKKQAEISLLTKEQTLKQNEIEKQSLLKNIFAVIIFLVIILVFILAFSISQKRKTNVILTTQKQDLMLRNEEINQQKEEIITQSEELQKANGSLNTLYQELQTKNKNIISSITYALRIQNAIIPTELELQKHFDCFVFFRPKDIVSGDFYFFADKGNTKILALADCTGHGVSGAFMTMIAHNILNQIVHDMEIHQPDRMLNLMSPLLEKTLLHSEGKVKDGMDISIITLTFGKFHTFQKLEKLEYAGAMNPLYYIQNQEFTEIKADKVPIGEKRHEDFVYSKHEILLSFAGSENPQGLNLYLCSDGFQDQFGGEQNRKFMVGNFKKLLLEISEKTLPEQKQVLEQRFENWKGKEKQTDDILVMGIRV